MPATPPGLPHAAATASLALLAAVASCVPPGDELDAHARIELDFNDPEQRRLYDLQDRLAVDSLLAHLGDEAPATRYLAARAFGSVLDARAVEPLAALLADPTPDVRAAAAFALGQQGDAAAEPALVRAFDPTDTTGAYAEANAAILEAAGKVGDAGTLAALTGVSTYLPTDTALLVGQARGIYRLGLRGVTSDEAVAVMVERATDARWPTPARLVAAHYLKRVERPLDGYGQRLAGAIPQERDAYVRAALAEALGRSGDAGVPAGLARLFGDERHPLVRAGLLRGAARRPYGDVRELLLAGATAPTPLVAETAAEVLRDVGAPEDAARYWRTARDSVADRGASLDLYGAALRHLPVYMQQTRQAVNGELIRRFRASADPAERADLLRALAGSPWNFRYLVERALEEPGTPASVAAAEALDAIAARPDIQSYFRGSYRAVRREVAAYLRRAVESGDPGLQAVAATTLARPGWDFGDAYGGDLAWLADAQEGLRLPRDTEALYLLDAARAALEPGYTARAEPPAYNHDILWDTYRSLQPGLEVAIETPRGLIVVDLLEEAAPGAVVNFVELVRNGSFNGKRFHRVEPGFVTQGGGPRGDGYGGADYTLRTETPPGVYYDRPGYVGMASAGRHTEGVQFFVTHQPTPHLDGRYTLLGRVVEGLDNVWALRRGDEMRMRLR